MAGEDRARPSRLSLTMFDRNRFDNLFGRVVAAVVLVLAGATLVAACPFCTVESRTLTEEISASEAVVLAKLIADAPPVAVDAENDTDPDSGKATFQVVDVLRGAERVNSGDPIKVVYFGEGENDDPLLAQDAYDEFARAPYSEVHELKGHMYHDRLVEWIQSSDVNPSRRRLYLTMLGVCGDQRDLAMLEGMIASDYSAKKPIVEQMVALGQALGGPLGLDMWTEMVDLEERQKKRGLDAAVACYLTLRGPDGLDLIDERFLKNPKVEYTHAYMTIMALRF